MRKVIFIMLIWIVTAMSALAALNMANLRDVSPETVMERKEEVTEIMEWKKEVLSEAVYENKNKVIQKITSFITKLEKTKQAVNNSLATAETKTAVNNSIDQTINYLTELQIAIEKAESAEEIQQIITDSTQRLRAQKEAIKKELHALKAEVQSISTTQIEQAIAEIEQILRLLKIVCPAQAEAIAVIESNLEELETLLIEINNNIKEENYQAATTLIIESNELIIETTLAIQALSNGCLL